MIRPKVRQSFQRFMCTSSSYQNGVLGFGGANRKSSSSSSSLSSSSSCFVVFTDGACRGNPGRGGCGAVLINPRGEEVDRRFAYVGENVTCNLVEYRAALLGVALAKAEKVNRLLLKTDSLLLCNQMNGLYRVKSAHLEKLYEQLKHETREFASFDIEHIPRKLNTVADQLANQAIDEEDERHKKNK